MTYSLSRQYTGIIVWIRDWWAKRRLDFWRWVVDYHLERAADHTDAAYRAQHRVRRALCDWAIVKK